MKKLSKDIVIKLALELNPPDLVNFCVTEKEVYRNVCDSKEFWILKLKKDYPELFEKLEKPILNPKEKYMIEITFVSKNIEETVDRIAEYTKNDHTFYKIKPYFNEEKYKEDIYKKIYKIYENIDYNDFKKNYGTDIHTFIDENNDFLDDISLFHYEMDMQNDDILGFLQKMFWKLISHKLRIETQFDAEDDIESEEYNIENDYISDNDIESEEYNIENDYISDNDNENEEYNIENDYISDNDIESEENSEI